MRELAKVGSDKLSTDVLALADQIAEDTANLEAELIKAGYLPKPSQP